MDSEAVSRRIQVWYRFTRRRTRGLRRLCITILSVALVVDRVVSLSAGLLPGSTCWRFWSGARRESYLLTRR